MGCSVEVFIKAALRHQENVPRKNTPAHRDTHTHTLHQKAFGVLKSLTNFVILSLPMLCLSFLACLGVIDAAVLFLVPGGGGGGW